MDTVLQNLIEVFESTRADGADWRVSLIVFANGMRFAGGLITLDEFLSESSVELKVLHQGLENAAEAMARKKGVSLPDICDQSRGIALHLRLSSILSGPLEHRFPHGGVVRIDLSSVAAWTTGSLPDPSTQLEPQH